MNTKQMAAEAAIYNERIRQQLSEGFDENHDLQYTHGELEDAADCYFYHTPSNESSPKPETCPWEPEWCRPKDRRRNVIRAGALYLAEIHRAVTSQQWVSSMEDLNKKLEACINEI